MAGAGVGLRAAQLALRRRSKIVESEAVRVLVLSHRYKSEMRADALPAAFAPELEEFKYQVL